MGNKLGSKVGNKLGSKVGNKVGNKLLIILIPPCSDRNIRQIIHCYTHGQWNQP